jgi:GTP-binding protein
MRWLGSLCIPFSIILTKADKKYGTLAKKNHTALLKALSEDWESIPPIFPVSAHDTLGIEPLWTYISTLSEPK